MGDFNLDLVPDVPLDLYVGGKVVPASDGSRFDVLDPATGNVIASVADGSVDDALSAADAAASAAEAWAAFAPRERSEVLRRAFELMTRRAGDLAHVISL